MKFSLKNHPFAVETFFESSLVLTFAVPKEALQALLPECLELDTFDDKWAFIAIAMVQSRNLRPKGFPAFMGNDFFLTGYRIFTKYTTNEGKRLRGLYILKSETNSKKMSFLGNVFTHYNYTTTDIELYKDPTKIAVRSIKSNLAIEVKLSDQEVSLPKNSPFKDWKEARRFAGPLPFTFSYNAVTKEVLIIEGVRENWIPRAVEIVQSEVGFVLQKKIEGTVLANAFVLENIPYYWKKGKTELWKG